MPSEADIRLTRRLAEGARILQNQKALFSCFPNSCAISSQNAGMSLNLPKLSLRELLAVKGVTRLRS